MHEIIFEVPGRPRGKGRARATKAANHVRMYTDRQTLEFENLIMACFLKNGVAEMFPREPIKIEIRAYFAPRKSWPKWKRKEAESGKLRMMQVPDTDNIVKVVMDALNGLAYHDDSQVTEIDAAKAYGPRDYMRIKLTLARGEFGE